MIKIPIIRAYLCIIGHLSNFHGRTSIDLIYNQSSSGIFSRADCCNFKNSIIWRCGRLFFFCLGKKLTSTDGIALRIRQTGICRRFGLPFVPKLNFKQWIFQRRLIACHPNIAYNLTTWLRGRHTHTYF